MLGEMERSEGETVWGKLDCLLLFYFRLRPFISFETPLGKTSLVNTSVDDVKQEIA